MVVVKEIQYKRQVLLICCENSDLFYRSGFKDPFGTYNRLSVEDIEDLIEQSNNDKDRDYWRDTLEYKLENKDKSSLFRSRRSIQNIVKSNDWDFFVTLTFADRESDNNLLLRRTLNRFKYLLRVGVLHRYCLVPELQKDGTVHFHGFIACDRSYMSDSGTVKAFGFEHPIYFDTYVKLCPGVDFDVVYNWSLWGFGWSVCYEVHKCQDKLLNYMIKYILKDTEACFDTERSRRYFAGGDLLRDSPSKIFYSRDNLKLSDLDFKVDGKPLKEYNTIFGKIKYIQLPEYKDKELADIYKFLDLRL